MRDKNTPSARFEDEYQPYINCSKPLPAPKGSLITWVDNLVHWSSPCQAGHPEPRISVAATFFREGTDRGGETAETGILSRKELKEIGLKKRLEIIAGAMLLYSHWHPGFKGFPETTLAGERQG